MFIYMGIRIYLPPVLGAIVGDFLLQENGSFLLQEDGFKISL